MPGYSLKYKFIESSPHTIQYIMPGTTIVNEMSPVVLVCPVVFLVHHHRVQAIARLLHGHLCVHALDPRLTITQVGLKACDPLLNLPALSHQAGRHHLKLQPRHQPRYRHSQSQSHHLHLQIYLAGHFKVFQTIFFCFFF